VAVAFQERGAQGGGVGEGAVVGNGQTVRVVGVQRLRFRAQRLGARRGVPRERGHSTKKKGGLSPLNVHQWGLSGLGVRAGFKWVS